MTHDLTEAETANGQANGRARRDAPPGPPLVSATMPLAGAREVDPHDPRYASGSASAPSSAKRPKRLTSAGRCLFVGLICFAVWTLFDANQLYQSANAAPPGARRTVSMTILRPIAAVANALALSGIVNSANSALGRQNGPGDDGGAGSNYDPTVLAPPNDPLAVYPPVSHHLKGAILPRIPTSANLPPLAQPTAAAPLVMLDIGDSLGEDLGFGLGDQFGGDSYISLDQEAVESTGLADPAYYDWPQHLQQYLQQYHPKVVVVMLGGNDTNNFTQDNVGVAFGTQLWRKDYAERVDEMMQEATAAGVRVLWVGMPIMQSTGFSAEMQQLNTVYQQQAAKYPGVTYFSSWSLFATSSGQYSEYLTTSSGSEIDARDPDGVHIAPGGYDMLASALVPAMQKAWGIRLAP